METMVRWEPSSSLEQLFLGTPSHTGSSSRRGSRSCPLQWPISLHSVVMDITDTRFNHYLLILLCHWLCMNGSGVIYITVNYAHAQSSFKLFLIPGVKKWYFNFWIKARSEFDKIKISRNRYLVLSAFKVNIIKDFSNSKQYKTLGILKRFQYLMSYIMINKYFNLIVSSKSLPFNLR